MHNSNLYSKNKFVLLIAITWLVVSLMLAVNCEMSTTMNSHNTLVVFNVISYVLCLYSWISTKNRILSMYTIFVVYLFMSNMAQSLLYAVGFHWDIAYLYYLYTIGEMNQLLCYELVCIASLNLGTAIAVFKTKNCVTASSLQLMYNSSKQPAPSAENQILTVITAVVWLYEILFAMKMFFMRQSMTYSEVYLAAQDMRGSLGSYVSYLAMFLSLWNILQRRHLAWMYTCIILVVVLYMLVGTRSRSIVYVAILLLTLPMVKPQWFKKKYWILWIGAAILSFSGLSIITNTRSNKLDSDVNMSAIEEGSTNASVNTMLEMGGSARTIVLTQEAIDAGFPKHQTIIYSLINAIIPGFNYTGILAKERLQLSGWVTEYANSLDSGLGYSIIAESYMNYGWYGWIFMVLYGCFLAYTENFAYRKFLNREYMLSVMLLLLLAKNIFSARGELALMIGFVRMPIYLYILNHIYRLIKNS